MTRENLINRASALARMWATSSSQNRTPQRVARILAEPAGMDFAVKCLDRVARPEDPVAAARGVERLDPRGVTFLSAVDRALLRTGHVFAPYWPRLVAATAQKRVRRFARGNVAEARDHALTRHIATTLTAGYRPNLSLLGEAVLGERQARSHAEAVLELLRRDDVDYVSLHPSSLVSHLSPWDVLAEAQRVAERLRPILEQAAATTPHKFVTLDIDAYRDLAITVEVFEMLLSEGEFMHLSAGIALPSSLPDSNEALRRLIGFATARVEAGGAPIKVRLLGGATLAMEKVEAELHGWALAPYPDRRDADANHLRLIDAALRPEVSYAVRIGVASDDLFPIAYAHLLAVDRGVEAALDVEMFHGVAPGNAAAVRAEVANPIVVYTPLLAREDFPLAVPYLVRRLEEAAVEHRYLRDHFTPDIDGRERAFLAAAARDAPSAPRRSHIRPLAPGAPAPDSDPALAAVRARVRAAVDAPLPQGVIPAPATAGEVDDVVARSLAQAHDWRNVPAQERAATLREIADELERQRGALLGALAHEVGKCAAEADREVSTAIDLARYYAGQAEQLAVGAEAEGVEFSPDRVVLIATSWRSPIAELCGGVFAALAAGAAAVALPAPQAPQCAHLGAEAIRAGLRASGRSESLVHLAGASEGEAERALVSHRDVDSVILSGEPATAQLFTSWRVGHPRGPRIFADTPGKNSVIITPSADYDAAVADALRSAFSHAGQEGSGVSVLILVGAAARSPQLRQKLADAVESLPVDWPTNMAARVGPLIAPARGEVAQALTSLEEGEEWWVTPQQLDDAGRLWSPGLKAGVLPGSPAHLAASGAPVLGIMVADSLEEAIAWQNAPDSGGYAGGIHSLDPNETEAWADAVEVGSAFINRPSTGAVVQRQPRGGWNESAVGPGAKIGGPNYVAQLGQWEQVASPASAGEIGPRVEEFLDLTASWVPPADHDWLRECARSDADARDHYRTPVDPAGLAYEENVFRYRPGPRMTIRAGAHSSLTGVLRLVAVSLAAGVEAGVSAAPEVFEALPAQLQQAWKRVNSPVPEPPAGTDIEDSVASGPAADAGPGPAPAGVPAGIDLSDVAVGVIAGWRSETIEEFTTRASTWVQSGRVRSLEAGETPAICEAVSTSIAVLDGPPLQSGRRELLGFLREQTVSRPRHRFGHVDTRPTPATPGSERPTPSNA